jgi:hypothetical protein
VAKLEARAVINLLLAWSNEVSTTLSKELAGDLREREVYGDVLYLEAGGGTWAGVLEERFPLRKLVEDLGLL